MWRTLEIQLNTKVDLSEIAQTETSDAPEDNRFQVWVGHDQERLHPVAVTKGTTVGQLAIAANCFISMTEPVRTMTAMGSHLPVYTHLQPNQVVLLEHGQNDHEVTYPFVSGMTRADALWKQQGWVATGEMSFYLRMIGKPNLANTTPPLIMNENDKVCEIFEE